MKLSPKHYRLLSILDERGSVPADFKSVVMPQMLSNGLVEEYCGDEQHRAKTRYRLTVSGRKLLDDYNARVEQSRLLGPWQGRR
ncbi:hypothetical protein ACCY16_20020 [Candidatus Pantoea formicae]|uniref:hypothetical protein n=1 Tax=Candidatus Pantoea formicae TaxID=2608355 RepID=UPI003EDAEC61